MPKLQNSLFAASTVYLHIFLGLQIKLEAKQIVRERGLERVRLEDIVAEITPKGRATVPDEVKRELLTKVRWS